MKGKNFRAGLTLLIAFTFSSIAFAQSTSPGRNESQEGEVFKGTVTAIDLLTNSLYVKGKKSEETFRVDPQTRILINNKASKLSDIKKEQKVTVIYRVEGGNKVATVIR